jgi:hypothetical protein
MPPYCGVTTCNDVFFVLSLEMQCSNIDVVQLAQAQFYRNYSAL